MVDKLESRTDGGDAIYSHDGLPCFFDSQIGMWLPNTEAFHRREKGILDKAKEVVTSLVNGKEFDGKKQILLPKDTFPNTNYGAALQLATFVGASTLLPLISPDIVSAADKKPKKCEGIEHKLVKGENPSSVAKIFNVPVSKVLYEGDATKLRVGQKVCVVDSEKGASAPEIDDGPVDEESNGLPSLKEYTTDYIDETVEVFDSYIKSKKVSVIHDWMNGVRSSIREKREDLNTSYGGRADVKLERALKPIFKSLEGRLRVEDGKRKEADKLVRSIASEITQYITSADLSDEFSSEALNLKKLSQQIKTLEKLTTGETGTILTTDNSEAQDTINRLVEYKEVLKNERLARGVLREYFKKNKKTISDFEKNRGNLDEYFQVMQGAEGLAKGGWDDAPDYVKTGNLPDRGYELQYDTLLEKVNNGLALAGQVLAAREEVNAEGARDVKIRKPKKRKSDVTTVPKAIKEIKKAHRNYLAAQNYMERAAKKEEDKNYIGAWSSAKKALKLLPNPETYDSLKGFKGLTVTHSSATALGLRLEPKANEEKEKIKSLRKKYGTQGKLEVAPAYIFENVTGQTPMELMGVGAEFAYNPGLRMRHDEEEKFSRLFGSLNGKVSRVSGDIGSPAVMKMNKFDRLSLEAMFGVANQNSIKDIKRDIKAGKGARPYGILYFGPGVALDAEMKEIESKDFGTIYKRNRQRISPFLRVGYRNHNGILELTGKAGAGKDLMVVKMPDGTELYRSDRDIKFGKNWEVGARAVIPIMPGVSLEGQYRHRFMNNKNQEFPEAAQFIDGKVYFTPFNGPVSLTYGLTKQLFEGGESVKHSVGLVFPGRKSYRDKKTKEDNNEE